MYCVGGSLKKLCHFEMGGGGVWQMLTSSGGSLNADRGEGGQNLADVICERSLSNVLWSCLLLSNVLQSFLLLINNLQSCLATYYGVDCC